MSSLTNSYLHFIVIQWTHLNRHYLIYNIWENLVFLKIYTNRSKPVKSITPNVYMAYIWLIIDCDGLILNYLVIGHMMFIWSYYALPKEKDFIFLN